MATAVGLVEGRFGDRRVGWLTESDVVFEDPRIMFATENKRITGYLTGVILYPFEAVPTLEFLYFANATLNGVLLRELRLPIESVNRLVVRRTDFDVETEAQKYTVKTEDPAYDATSQPRLVMKNGRSVYVGRLPVGVVARSR